MFTYLFGLPTSSLLTSGGVGGFEKTYSTTHLPVFTYLLGLPTSSLLTSGGVGGFKKTYSTTNLPVFTYLLGLPTSSLLTSGGVGGFEKTYSTTHLPVFTYLLRLPTSSLLASGGVGGFEKNVSMSLPLIYQCLLTYSVFPLHLCWHLEGLVALRRSFPSHMISCCDGCFILDMKIQLRHRSQFNFISKIEFYILIFSEMLDMNF